MQCSQKLIGDAIGVRLQDHLKMCVFASDKVTYVGSFDTNNAKNSAMLDSISLCIPPYNKDRTLSGILVLVALV